MKSLGILVILSSILLSSLSAQTHVHTLQKNETLYSLAKKYNVSVQALISVNEIENPSNLPVGMKLTIPNSYEVQRGDTFYSIARRYDTSVEELLQVNGLKRDYVLQVGDVLSLPGSQFALRDDKEESGQKDEEKATEISTQGTPSRNKTAEGETAAPSSGEKEGSTGAEDSSYGNDLMWPVNGRRIVLEGKLSGTRIYGKRGDPVVSISSGEVVWVGPYRGFGNVVLIQSPDRYIYVYGGNENIKVEVGDTVEPGMEIASLGVNPHGEKPALFFTVYKDGKPVDPEKAPRI